MRGRNQFGSFAAAPKEPGKEDLRVVGIGGGGGNALNHMITTQRRDVNYLAINTDMAHLEQSSADTKIPVGLELTKGLGAGANPEIGCKAAMESAKEIKGSLEGADMVFLTAGLGGGTGTGAAPVVAKAARDVGALTVGIVTRPFTFEGQRRMKQAQEGLQELRDAVDALVVIPNDRLLDIVHSNTSLLDAFSMVDDILSKAVAGVIDLIVSPGLINVDFADVRTVLSDAGTAFFGTGKARGEERVSIASRRAISCPLLETSLRGAKGVLFTISGSQDMKLNEVNEAASLITEAADEEATIIWGHNMNEQLEDAVEITVIATGFPAGDAHPEGRKIESILGSRGQPQSSSPQGPVRRKRQKDDEQSDQRPVEVSEDGSSTIRRRPVPKQTNYYKR
ncbi:MAG: cell division protein FtsZ [Synergistales bacterium]|nr:cell division protein FtsZ [Synergistales bacterium]